MTNILKPLMIASAILASSTAMTTAASAQVSGIGIINPEGAIARAKALAVASTQIETQYKAQLDEIEGREERIRGYRATLDTNSDQQLTEQELQANPTVVQQIQAENSAIETLTTPIVLAQMFTMEQVAAQYPTAQQQVVTEKNINLLLGSSSVLYLAPTLDADKEIKDISSDVITKLDALAPVVNINVPQGWQPSRQTQALYQQIQQIRIASARRAAQAAQAGQAAAAPASQQPTGR